LNEKETRTAPFGDVERPNRVLFDATAELYERARPGYPAALFDDLVALSEAPARGRVLEIGCGTGQATLPMAERGFQIDAVELGRQMARLARHKVARYANARVHTSTFEAWPLPEEPFDLVMAATAFHWLDPDIRYVKAAAALRRLGALAVFANHHVAGGDEQFFVDVQACYERYMPGTPPGLRMSRAGDIAPQTADIAASGLFEAAAVRRYVWERTYSTAAYLDVLGTYSGHLALPPSARESLLGCIARLIDEGYAGQIRKQYLTELIVARKRD